jgi:hypothetical protein
MGTFTDNFIKQAALLLAVTCAMKGVQGKATVLFALPFVLFSAWAGWCADKFPKRAVAVYAKILEVGAMAIAAWAVCAMHWEGLLAVMFLMGLQSTFFSPALNGAIPENFAAFEVPGVNAYIKLASTAAILMGMACAGFVLDIPRPESLDAAFWLPDGEYGFGRVLVGLVALLVAAVGLAAALSMKRTPAPGSAAPFPFLGCIDSGRHALECRRNDPLLYVVLAGEAFFYGISAFATVSISNLGKEELGFSFTRASLLPVALMAGICAGALIAGRRRASAWRSTMLPSGASTSIPIPSAAAIGS